MALTQQTRSSLIPPPFVVKKKDPTVLLLQAIEGGLSRNSGHHLKSVLTNPWIWILDAFFGANTTGRFSRIGKPTWFKLFLEAEDDVIAAMCTLCDDDSKLFH